MPQPHVFLNGNIIPESEVQFPQPDLGLFRGLSVFDFLRTHKHKPLSLPLYLKRFRRSAQAFNLALAYSDAQLTEIIFTLIEKNNFQGEQGIRLLLTGGASADVFTVQEPSLYIRTEPSRLPDSEFYTEGAVLISKEYQREYPTVKNTNYTQVLLACPEAQRVNAQEVLYYFGGEVLECSRSNFFMVKEGVMVTPATEKVLAGITRHTTIQLAQELGFPVEERNVLTGELANCQEAFITSTTKAVMPIVQIDDDLVGNGKVGPVTRQLLQTWQEYLANLA
jgi:branched-subunit amino acid aminotransferase/4-amino-4-deoxychorismate lyase